MPGPSIKANWRWHTGPILETCSLAHTEFNDNDDNIIFAMKMLSTEHVNSFLLYSLMALGTICASICRSSIRLPCVVCWLSICRWRRWLSSCHTIYGFHSEGLGRPSPPIADSHESLLDHIINPKLLYISLTLPPQHSTHVSRERKHHVTMASS